MRIRILLTILLGTIGIFIYETISFEAYSFGGIGSFLGLDSRPQSRMVRQVSLRQRYKLTNTGISYRGFNKSKMAVPQWQQQLSTTYSQALVENGPYTALVLPFQMSGFSDVPTRLFAAGTLEQLVELSGEKVPPVEFVRNVLGMHTREYDDMAVYALAERLGVKKIYWGFMQGQGVFHPGPDGTMARREKVSIDVIRQELKEGSSWGQPDSAEELQATCEKVRESAETIIIRSYLECVPVFGKKFGIPEGLPKTLYTLRSDLYSEDNFYITIPEDVYASDPLSRALHLQLLGLLVPDHVPYFKQDFFVRSLLALNHVDPESSEYRLLLARAYLHLGIRPFAVEILKAPITQEEKAFVQVLNGNLEGLKETVALIKNPTLRLLAEIEYVDLDFVFNGAINKDEIQRIAQLRPQWEYEVMRRLEDQTLWQQHNNFILKRALDEFYPIAGFSFEDIVQSLKNEADKNQAMIAIDMSFQKHIDLAREDYFKKKTDRISSAYDYLVLLESIGQANLMRQVLFRADTQGNEEVGLALIRAYKKIYKGHPLLLRVESRLLERLPGGDSDRSSAIKNEEIQFMRNTADYFYGPGPVMVRSGSSEFENGFLVLRRSEWSHDRINFLRDDIDAAIQKNRLVSSLENEVKARFIGHPARIALDLPIAIYHGDEEAVERLYQDTIKKYPDYWGNFSAYGEFLLYRGRFEEAAQLYSRYFSFVNTSSKINRVELSNYANDAGNSLLYRGRPEFSLPFFKIAEDLDTGSSSSMVGGAKYNLLRGDFYPAMEGFHRNAIRYGHGHSFYRYFSMLHLLDPANYSLSAEDDVIRKFGHRDLLYSKIVGERIHDVPGTEICQWVSNMEKIYPEFGDQGNFSLYFYLHVIMDRSYWDEGQSYPPCVLFKKSGGGDEMINTVVPSNKSSIPAVRINKTTIKHDIEGFFGDLIQLKAFIRNRDFNGAKLISEKIRGFCDAIPPEIKYQKNGFWYCDVSQYAALADAHLSKTIEGRSLDLWLSDELPESKAVRGYAPVYTHYLKKAIAAALLGQQDKTVDFLEIAYAGMQEMLAAQYTQPVFYEFLEFSEYLYVYTSDQRIRKLIVTCARDLQKIEPWNSWSYTFDALYAEDPNDQLRALAIGLYLDRRSERLSKFTNAERLKAEEWFKKHNPFVKPPTIKRVGV